MKLSQKAQTLLHSQKAPDSYDATDNATLSTEVISRLTEGGLSLDDAVLLILRLREASWFTGYDVGYKRGTDENA